MAVCYEVVRSCADPEKARVLIYLHDRPVLPDTSAGRTSDLMPDTSTLWQHMKPQQSHVGRWPSPASGMGAWMGEGEFGLEGVTEEEKTYSHKPVW